MNIQNDSQPTPLPHIKLFFHFLGWLHFVASIFSIVGEAILQHSHGHRFLSWWRILTITAIQMVGLWIWTTGIKIWRFVILPSHSPDWGVEFISVWIGFALFGRISITWRRLKGAEGYHPFSRGQHYFKILGLPNEAVFQFLHPSIIWATAVHIPDGIVQVFLAVTGLAIFVRVAIDGFFLQRHRDDFSAGTIEGKELKQPESTDAAVNSTIVSTSEDMSQDDPSTVDDSYNSLPEHLQNIIYRS